MPKDQWAIDRNRDLARKAKATKISETVKPQKMPFVPINPPLCCPKCKIPAKVEIEKPLPNGKSHLGLYCGQCGKWIKWLKKTNKSATGPKKPGQKKSRIKHTCRCCGVQRNRLGREGICLPCHFRFKEKIHEIAARRDRAC